jgi:hypothetical protein
VAKSAQLGVSVPQRLVPGYTGGPTASALCWLSRSVPLIYLSYPTPYPCSGSLSPGGSFTRGLRSP